MSFEGYYQVLCEKGHLTDIDCYKEPILSKELYPPFIKPEEAKLWTCRCGSRAAWWNLVDVTNGSFDIDGIRIDGYIYLQKNSVVRKCGTCGGNIQGAEEPTYKMPQKGGHRVEPLSESFGAWAESGKEAPPPPLGPPTRLIKEGVEIVKSSEWVESGKEDKDLDTIYKSRDTHCHHDGKRHSVPSALVKLVAENIAQGNFASVKHTTSGGNTCYAEPVVMDGEAVRVDFWTDVGD
jgi:hypothetical protein